MRKVVDASHRCSSRSSHAIAIAIAIIAIITSHFRYYSISVLFDSDVPNVHILWILADFGASFVLVPHSFSFSDVVDDMASKDVSGPVPVDLWPSPDL